MLYGSFRLDCLPILNVVIYALFNSTFFTNNPKMIIFFFLYEYLKSYSPLKLFFLLFNSEESQTLIFLVFYMLIEHFRLVFVIAGLWLKYVDTLRLFLLKAMECARISGVCYLTGIGCC